MSFLPDGLPSLVRGLAVPGDRRAAARALAAAFGADDALLFVRDEEIGIFLPATGFLPTLRGTGAYRNLLQRAVIEGTTTGTLDWWDGRSGPAVAMVAGTGLVLFGLDDGSKVEAMRPYLEILETVYASESARTALEGRFAVVMDTAQEVESLAHQLDLVRKGLEERVQARTDELNAALKEAEGFNYSVAHDLRAPVRAISATAMILLEELGPEVSDEHRRFLERQAYNASRLGVLIDELLRLSRLSRVDVRRMPLDLTRLTDEVVSELRTGLDVRVQEGMRATGDPELVRTVLHNLIGNACKFSPRGAAVEVGQSGGAVWVRDEGIGFDMGYAEKIFQPFERLVTESEFPGTGIGLANVERIVRRHGGRVWAESKPGKGATFSFTLA
ncbi:hypothetical protein BH11ARM2_BH11ARM2_31350 [soil metagenome]